MAWDCQHRSSPFVALAPLHSGGKSAEVQTEAKRTAVESNQPVPVFSEFKKKKKSEIFFYGTSKGLHLSSLPPFLEISKKKMGEEKKM